MDNINPVTHEFEPIFNQNSRVLILGTFPSVKSRENQFYYGHPQNRFWKVMASLTDSNVPITIDEKYSQEKTGREIIGLPSTSPANAAFSLERLLGSWFQVKGYLHK